MKLFLIPTRSSRTGRYTLVPVKRPVCFLEVNTFLFFDVCVVFLDFVALLSHVNFSEVFFEDIVVM